MNYIEIYKNHLIGSKKSVHTITAYISDIKMAIEFIGKNESDVQFIDVDNWKSSIINQAPATINRKIVALHKYFDYLEKMKIVSENPVDGIDNVKMKSVRNKTYIPFEEAKKLLEYGKERDKAIISVYLTLGLRVSEMCNLTIDNYYDGECDIITKGEVTRHIIFNDSCKKYIEDYLKYRYTSNNLPWLFISNRGTQMDPKSISGMLKTAAKKVGLPTDISNHSLRRTFISSICDKKGISFAQHLVCHSSINITSRYAYNTNEQYVEAYNEIVI